MSLRGQAAARAGFLKRLLLQRAVQRQAPEGRRRFAPLASPEGGRLDGVEAGVVAGWAREEGAPDRVVEVDIYLDRRFVARIRADRPRGDLAGLPGFGAGRHGFLYPLPPGAALGGCAVSVHAARSGLELGGSPRRTWPASPTLSPPVRRALQRLSAPAARAVTLADQGAAYGVRLARLVERDPDYPDDEAHPVSRAMGYVDARFHGGLLAGSGPSGFFDLFEASARHFASAPAGLPVGPDLLAALTAPVAAGPFGSALARALRLRAGLAPDDPRLAGIVLDYLHDRRLPLELLGDGLRAWLAADPARWRAALREVQALAPASRSDAALEAAAAHLGLEAALGRDPGAAPPGPAAPPVADGVRVLFADYGDSGLGVNTRRSLEALAALGLPHDSIGLDLREGGRAEPIALGDIRRCVLIHAQPDDAVELILRLPAEQSAQRLIGFFMWETEGAPPAFSLGLHLVDEVWTGSSFCRDAFAAAAPTPVTVVGHAVTPAPAEPGLDGRALAGAPQGAFLAYTHYDARSWITRKNPLAVAQAFRRAFPGGDEPACLVIKTRGEVGDAGGPARGAWEALQALAERDGRIRILDRDLAPPALTTLMQACDVYLSLHRGEGFGYGPAEAILAGRPLIVSAYGGPLDFAQGAWLVPCRRRPIRPGEFVASGVGQVWGEPDVEAAARHLRAIYDAPAPARRRAEAARTEAQAELSLAALARRYARALDS